MDSIQVGNVIGALETAYRHSTVNGRPRDFSYWHPSQCGGCSRKESFLNYAENGIGGLSLPIVEHEGPTARIFKLGHIVHADFQEFFADYLGVARGRWSCKNKLCKAFDDNGKLCAKEDKIKEILSKEGTNSRIYGQEELIGIFKPEQCACGCKEFQYEEIIVKDSELNIKGNCDMICDFSKFDAEKFQQGNKVTQLFDIDKLPKKPFIVDFKTSGSKKFSTLGSISNDGSGIGTSMSYREQMIIYCNILNIDAAVLLYMNKDNCKLHPITIYKNEQDYSLIKNRIIIMNEMAKKNKLPPPRPSSKSSYECKNCPFKNKCHTSSIWDDPNFNDIRHKFYGHLLED